MVRQRDMRVLLTADVVGGIWTYATDLAAELVSRGVQCTIALLGPSPPGRQLSAAAGCDVRYTGLPLDWLAPDADAVRAAGCTLAALAARSGADLVHLHAPAFAAAAEFSVPLVVSCHSCVRTWWHSVRGEGELPPNLAWQSELAAEGHAAADVLLAPTRAFADATRAAYHLREAPIVIHNGRRTLASPERAAADCVLTVGRLWDEGKNVAALDRIASRLQWPVFAAGPTEGPNGAWITLQHVAALGPLTGVEIAAWLAQRPLFVSLARYEPFGLAVLEAAQAGCALILADIPSFRELWDGAALFVPPDDEAEGTERIEALMRAPDERACWGARAASRSRRYTAAAMADGTERIYRALTCTEAAV